MDSLYETCVCGHSHGSHDEQGCMMCDAQGKECAGFWSEAERQEAENRALMEIKREQDQREQRGE